MSRRVQRLEILAPAGRLEALWVAPADETRAVALLCHPHPLHGGSMHTKALYRAGRALVEAGVAVLRFNFRGVGRSDGAFDDGNGELEDARAAHAWLDERHPRHRVLLGGFSFGAWIALRLDADAGRADALLALAPPLELYDFTSLAREAKPLLVVAGANDPLCPPAAVEAWGVGRDADLAVLPDTTHLLVERPAELREAVQRFATRALQLSS